MASSALATIGTLSEFDIVLSISEEAINRQFKKLYDTKIDQGGPLPPPPGLEDLGVAPPVKTEYLINHDLQIHLAEMGDNGPEVDYEAGIVGHIRSPKIDLHNTSTPNTARISLTFEQVDGTETPNSVYNYWVGKGRNAKIKTTVINEWTMSWEAKLGQANIKNIVEELIEPAKSNTKPEVLHPKLLSALDKVSSKHFTVASIFCICEAAQLANTFQLRDDKGEFVDESLLGGFMLRVSRYFSSLQQKIRPGGSTPDHPFVLGYGLSQEIQDIKEILTDTKDDTPKYFIPRDYLVTTTPGEKGSNYTGGTFNFCISTHREDDGEPKREAIRTDPETNANAGRLQKTFFDVTKTREQDGIMGFCRDLIFDKFLCDVLARPFHINIGEIFKKAMSKGTAEVKDSSETSKIGDPLRDGMPPTWSGSESLKLDGKIENWLLDDKQTVQGSSTIKVWWESDLQTNEHIEEKDARRQARFVIESYVKEYYDFVDVGVFSNDNLKAYIDMVYKYAFTISSGPGGRISIEKDPSNSVLPERGQDGKLKLLYRHRSEGEYGAFFTTTKDLGGIGALLDTLKKDPLFKAWDEFFQMLGFPSIFRDILQTTCTALERQWAEDIGSLLITEFESKWQNGIKALDNNILMPAGEVFTFSGTDIDHQGNLFSHISFALGSEKVGKGGAVDDHKQPIS
ncbi:hypothetical protein NM208_g6909 [Fusarium decemcellulare]|uniref:Uncharacterized protein n=1 Tax=Fusarium decemcellulare TaxID=57161 RepID=A0ACC1SB85_9HYPO|nr:hypothetical protein NM208_g6909 [Fusarium decemcellulare]